MACRPLSFSLSAQVSNASWGGIIMDSNFTRSNKPLQKFSVRYLKDKTCQEICIQSMNCYWSKIFTATLTRCSYTLSLVSAKSVGFFIHQINLLKPRGYFTYHQGLTFKNPTWRSLCVECFVRISEQTATFALYSINWLVFITAVESVYCAVRTDSLYKADYVSSLKG